MPAKTMDGVAMIPVVIVAYNRPEYTRACLESLFSSQPGIEILPVIVDNGSRRRTRTLIEKMVAPRGLIVRMDHNRGFAAALNAALARLKEDGTSLSDDVVLCHNDVIFFDGWAGEMSAVLSLDEDTAVVSPRTSYANEFAPCVPDIRALFETLKTPNKDRILPEEIMAVLSSTYPDGRPALLGHLRSLYPMRASYSPEISSFCMMTRRSLFDEYGGFDEEFDTRLWEDKFWFQPLERDGLVCQVANWAFVHHFGNITTDGPGFCFPELSRINEARFRKKCLARDAGDDLARVIESDVNIKQTADEKEVN